MAEISCEDFAVGDIVVVTWGGNEPMRAEVLHIFADRLNLKCANGNTYFYRTTQASPIFSSIKKVSPLLLLAEQVD